MAGLFNPDKEVKTTCPFCGAGCGLLAMQNNDGFFCVRGDPDHPASFGRLCSKSAALHDMLQSKNRLLAPQVNGRECNWTEALKHVASQFSEIISEHGPDAIAFLMQGNMPTETYYVANKLMKGFIGSANIDCGSPAVSAQIHAFGSDTVPGTYEDLELADVIVVAGIDLATTHSVIYQRILAAKAERPDMKIVVIDPNDTSTSIIADLHLPVHPNNETALFAGLLQYMAQNSVLDTSYIDKYTNGFDEALLVAAEQFDQETVKSKTGLKWKQLEQFYSLFCTRDKITTVFPQEALSASAIINCHLAIGRIGRPGMGPFAMAMQSNAMGAREVGSAPNMLAAHMDLENPEHRDCVQRFWQSPNIAMETGVFASDIHQAVIDGNIKAIWIISPDVIETTPELAEALAVCPFVVISEMSKTSELAAHVMLPTSEWAEKDGTVTNSDRYISRQRAFLEAPGDTKSEWWQICEVAKLMGFSDAFSYSGPSEIFAEHARLSAFENHQNRDFDIGHYARVSEEEYENLEPFQWPQPKQSPRKTTRFFAKGAFYTPDGRGRFIADSPVISKSSRVSIPADLEQEDNWRQSW